VGLRPYGERYLNSTFVNGKPEEGRLLYVRIFTGVAIFILIIACINFMNLATARSIKRAKEVGVRKVIGSSRASLVSQSFVNRCYYRFWRWWCLYSYTVLLPLSIHSRESK